MPDTNEGIIMKHRFFLLILAAFMATSSAWATCPQYFHDTIPAKRYITNFEVVWENKEYVDIKLPYLKFEDTFRPDLQLDRKYYISIEARHANDLNTGCKFRYITQADEPSATLHWNQYEYWSTYNDIQLGLGAHIEERPLDEGGDVIHQGLDIFFHFAVANGAREVIFFVQPEYKEVSAVTGDTKYVSYYGDAGDRQRLYNINYFTYTLPDIVKNKLSAPKEVKSGNKLKIESAIQAFGSVTYKLQERSNGNWRTIKSGSISTAEARAEKTIQYEEDFGNGHASVCEYRMIVTDVESNKTDTSEIQQVKFLYKQAFNDYEFYYCAGDTFYTYVEPDCWEYKVTSDLPVSKKIVGKLYEWIMPACDLTILYQEPTYTVKFFNQDYTLLKAEEVPCGGDATAPADPTMPNLYFDHWSRDFTNVHSNLTVWAQYTMAGNYYFDAQLIEHLNERHPMEGFAESTNRAIVGDALTFQATLLTPQEAKLYYETCYQNQDGTWTLWSAPTNNMVGSITAADVAAGQTKEFTKQVEVALQSNQERERTYGFAFRFYVICGGERINSEPFEYDVYYPVTVSSQIDFSGAHEGLFAENSDGLFNIGEELVLPTRYEDTIRIYRIEGGAGACINYTYVEHPSWGVHSGLDVEGNSYFLCPGATSTINVDVAKTLVIFDGVYGNGYPKQLDFTAEGFSKVNGYYGEVVPCGGSVTMPEDPTQENAIFLGWEAWSSDYADDAYLNIPVGESMIGFTAQFEYLPEVPTYTVIFFDKDGNILSTQEVKEGENAVPPVAPEVPGFHFVGWDSPYTTITNDKDITAVYGEDNKTWTVTYLNWDNSLLGTEQVNDGEAAQGVIATRTGYTFVGWSEDISSVKSNMTVTALFDVSVFTITYTIDGVEIMSEQVSYGAMPTAYQAIEDQGKPATEQYVYTFDHWSPAIVPAVADATYEAVFTPSLRKYLVRFQNWDHTLLSEQQVEYGKAAQAPADPTREGYTFKGWDREFNNIIADMTVTALFEKSKGQGIEDVEASATFDGAQKIIRNGQLFIERNGKTYNAQGAEIR